MYSEIRTHVQPLNKPKATAIFYTALGVTSALLTNITRRSFSCLIQAFLLKSMSPIIILISIALFIYTLLYVLHVTVWISNKVISWGFNQSYMVLSLLVLFLHWPPFSLIEASPIFFLFSLCISQLLMPMFFSYFLLSFYLCTNFGVPDSYITQANL